MQLGKVDLAFTLADTLAEAVKGSGPFKDTGAVGSVRTLAVLYTNYTHVVVRQGSGITHGRRSEGAHACPSARPAAARSSSPIACSRPRASIRARTSRATRSASPSRPARSRTANSTRSSGAAACRRRPFRIWRRRPALSMTLLPSDDLLPFLQRDFGKRPLQPRGDSGRRRIAASTKDVGTVGVKNLLVASSQLDDELVARDSCA